jgi:ParB family transcriptional regulator, chromosome partitioning protein
MYDQEVKLISLNDIEENPYQPRDVYEATALVALAASIREMGLLQVPVARKVGEKYQLAFGHRRKEAFEILYSEGWDEFAQMPLYIMDLTDKAMFEVAVTENIKRQELNPLERARALKRYMNEFSATSVQAAKLFGIPESTIRGTIRLLNLPEDAQQEMLAGKLSQTKARTMLEKPETKVKKITGSEAFDLREQLSILIYGRIRDVPDETLFKKVKTVFDEKKQMERQVGLMNSRKRDVLKLKAVPYDT